MGGPYSSDGSEGSEVSESKETKESKDSDKGIDSFALEFSWNSKWADIDVKKEMIQEQKLDPYWHPPIIRAPGDIFSF